MSPTTPIVILPTQPHAELPTASAQPATLSMTPATGGSPEVGAGPENSTNQ
jgi:hypothetical protein